MQPVVKTHAHCRCGSILLWELRSRCHVAAKSIASNLASSFPAKQEIVSLACCAAGQPPAVEGTQSHFMIPHLAVERLRVGITSNG